MHALRNALEELCPGPTPDPVPMGAVWRFTAREAVRRLYRSAMVHWTSRRGTVRRGSADAPRVHYLGVPSASARVVIGGAVKLIGLRARFPDSPDGFNVIYIVSSALPRDAAARVAKAKREGARFVMNQNGVAYPAWCGNFYPWFNQEMRALRSQADFIVYQSAFCQVSAERYLGPADAPSEILWNPVDCTMFRPGGTPDPGSDWRLLTAGTHHDFYRVRAGIDCLAALRRAGIAATLDIVGEFRWSGGDREVAAYLAREGMTDFVRRRPAFSRAEAPNVYRGMHVLLHPKYKDPCPTVPIEAMACGVPVVASRSGGMPELVPSQCGVLCDVPEDWTRDHTPDADALADAVRQIMANHASFSAAARTWACDAFEQSLWNARHAEIFQNVLR